MPLDLINLGAEPNDGTGDPPRVAGLKINTNFTELFDAVGALGVGGAAPVQSVAGKTGVVTLAKADVGLGAVDNTADAAKPISTATQAALNLKVNPYTESAETTYSTSATILIAHGLGVVPKDWHIIWRCITAELGYAVSDEIPSPGFKYINAVLYGYQEQADATNIVLIASVNEPLVFNKTTRIPVLPTLANWRIVARWRN
jgi:hypothetical protein